MPRPDSALILKAKQHVYASEQAEMHNEPIVAVHHATIAIQALLDWQASIINASQAEILAERGSREL